MGAGKHRILAAAVGKLGDCRMQPAVGWHGNLGKCLGKCHMEGCVVDVLRSEAEVDELGILLKTEFLEMAFQKVFHGLHVVVGHFLYILYLDGIGLREIPVYATQTTGILHRESRQLGKAYSGQGYEVFHFHQHPVAHYGVFGKEAGQGLALAAIAAVDRRDCGEFGKDCFVAHG